MLHEALWRANQDLARACVDHPFVQGLASGSLAAARFGAYVAQDAFFLRAFLQAWALALARAADPEPFRDLLNGAADELRLHRAYAAQLSLDLDHVTPTPPSRAYTDFLLHTAWQEDLGGILAAMTPCLRLYQHLGGALAPGSGGPYQRWIDTYSGPEFQQLATRVEALLDRHAVDTPAVRDHYYYAMRCELDFFSDVL